MLFVLFLLSAIIFPSISGKMGMRQCTGCICEASSACEVSRVSSNTPCPSPGCGPFRITKSYWADAGSLTIRGQKAQDDYAYDNCVQDVFCAAKTVRAFMTNQTTDCNQDGIVDCDDYVLIHTFGGGDCRHDLDDIGAYGKRYLHCKYLANVFGPEEKEEK